MANKVIRIDQSGNPVGNDGRMPCKKSTNDTISWTAQGTGGPWTITFTSATPISVSSLTVAQGGASSQYTVTGAVGDYSYSITDAGGTGGDPDIIVED
jgi:hypothetical protein